MAQRSRSGRTGSKKATPRRTAKSKTTSAQRATARRSTARRDKTISLRDRPWLKSYPPGVPESIEPYPEESVWWLLERSVERFPDSPAVSFPVAPRSKKLTYRQLKAQAEQFAGALAAMGVKKGDPVGLLLPNCPQFVVAWYACQRLGAIAVGNNPLYTQRELSHQLSDAGVRILVTLDLLYPLAAAVQDAVGLERVIVTTIGDYLGWPINKLAPIKQKKEAQHEGRSWPPVPADAQVTWWKDLMKASHGPLPKVDIDPKNDVAALVYTGGTTGLSKGAMLTHFNMVANALQTATWFVDTKEGEEGIMCVLPFFHSLRPVGGHERRHLQVDEARAASQVRA
jgi:long-chain acyl-CoA synthetase